MALILFPDFCFLVFQRDLSKDAIIEYSDKFYYVLNKYYKINKPITAGKVKIPYPITKWRNIFLKNMKFSLDRLEGYSFYLDAQNFHQEWEIFFDSGGGWHCFKVGILNESIWDFPPKSDEKNVLKNLIKDLVKFDVADIILLTREHLAFQPPISNWIGKTSRLYLQLKLNKIKEICHARMLKNPQEFSFSKFHEFLNFLDKNFLGYSKINILPVEEEAKNNLAL